MQSFFYPAIALMNRLRYPRKFALLGLMSLVAIAVVVYSLYASLTMTIQAAEQELEGVSLIKPLSQAVQLTQQHRGLSAGVIGGISSMEPMRAAKGSEVTEAFAKITARLPPQPKIHDEWENIQKDWRLLQQGGLTKTATENFAAHTRLIEQMLNLEVTLADDFQLTVDPGISSFYLIDTVVSKLPMAQEQIGRLRAYGVSILAKKQITQEQRLALYGLVVELDSALKLLRINLDKTGRHNPKIRATLWAVANDLADSTHEVVDLTTFDILSGHSLTRPNDYFMMTTAALDRSYAQLHNTILPTLDTLLKARIAHEKRVLHASTGIAILLFLIVTYFSIGMYLATIGSIRSLARSARKFSTGGTWVRVDLGTQDELQQVGDSFNEMADASNRMTAHLLEIQQALEQDVAERKVAEEKLAEAYDQLRLMARYLETVREEEQKRIARELHDEMGGVLAALNMNLARLQGKLAPQATPELDSMANLVAAAIQTMRSTVSKLRPSILDDAGLATAIACYATEFQQNTGISCRVITRLPEDEPALNRDRSATVFRILQESLTNVAKHAQADKVTIVLKERGDSLVLVVQDNGKGFDPDASGEGSYGLRGIRERVFMVSGKIRIRSEEGKGSTLWVSVPMEPPVLAQPMRATG